MPKASSDATQVTGLAVGWYYVEGEKTVGALNAQEMQIVLSKIAEPRNLLVWRGGFKDWARAGDVPELAELISKPPPLPLSTARHKRWASEGVWRSAGAVGVSLAIVWVASDYLIGAPLAALPIVVALDWATRQRRQFASRATNDKLRREEFDGTKREIPI